MAKSLIDYNSNFKTASSQKVVLIRPPSIVSRFAVAAPLVPPLGLVYIAATLRDAGHHVQVIDAVGENLDHPTFIGKTMLLRGLPFEEIAKHVKGTPDVIGVSCMFSSEWPWAHRVVKDMRVAFPNAKIVLGGEHFAATPEQSMKECQTLDAGVLGEGEETFLEYLEALSKGAPFANVEGLVYREPNGTIKVNESRGRIRNVDDIPLPAWDLIPLNAYLDRSLGLATIKGRSLPMLATRGCPFQCTFCSNPTMWSPKWIPRDPLKVLDEFEKFRDIYGVSDIQFFDLTAIIRKDWIIQFSKEIQRRKLNLTWQIPVGTRSEVIDREVARALADSGCFTMGFAPESGSPEVLDRIKKRVNLPKMEQAMSDCVDEGLNVKCNIMLGFPGETHKNVWESMKLIVKMSWLGVHDCSVYPFSPYPGSALFEELKAKGEIPKVYTDEYYLSLSYVEFSALRCYSEHFGQTWLRIYQFLGYALFYGTNYLFRPFRVLRLFRNLYTGKHETKGETILALFLNRVRGKTG